MSRHLPPGGEEPRTGFRSSRNARADFAPERVLCPEARSANEVPESLALQGPARPLALWARRPTAARAGNGASARSRGGERLSHEHRRLFECGVWRMLCRGLCVPSRRVVEESTMQVGAIVGSRGSARGENLTSNLCFSLSVCSLLRDCGCCKEL